MKKFLIFFIALVLNCSLALAENNLLNYEWWETATVEDVQREIANGADVNAKDKHGRTALMWACYSDNTEVVKALINTGADVNAKDNNGETAWYSAAVKGNNEVKKLLENAGAKPQKMKSFGKKS